MDKSSYRCILSAGVSRVAGIVHGTYYLCNEIKSRASSRIDVLTISLLQLPARRIVGALSYSNDVVICIPGDRNLFKA